MRMLGKAGIDFPPRSPSPDDREQPTAAEAKQELRQSVNKLERMRQEQREQRAVDFAEKHKISAEREAMIEAEQAYAEAVRTAYAQRTPDGEEPVVPIEAEQRYNEARLAWRKALQEAAASADEQDKVSAKFIGIRDTALRAEQVRTEAREAGLDSRQKEGFEKVRAWAKTFSKDLGGALMEVGGMYAKAADKAGGAFFVRNARARRIIGSAAIASLLVTASGGTALAAGFVVRVARGAIGVAAGASAGVIAGKIYHKAAGGAREKFVSTFTARDDEGKVVDTASTIEDIEREAAVIAASAKFTSRKKQVETVTAAAVGGLSAYGSSYVVNEDLIQGLSSEVKGIVGTAHAENVDTASNQPVEADVPVLTVEHPSGLVMGASIHESGAGTDHLFEELKERMGKSGLLDKDSSHVSAFVLESRVNDISHLVGAAAYGENGMVTHMGDQVFFDERMNLFYQPMGGEPQLFLENVEKSVGYPDGVKVHQLSAESTAPVEAPAEAPAPEPAETAPPAEGSDATLAEPDAAPGRESPSPEQRPPAPIETVHSSDDQQPTPEHSPEPPAERHEHTEPPQAEPQEAPKSGADAQPGYSTLGDLIGADSASAEATATDAPSDTGAVEANSDVSESVEWSRGDVLPAEKSLFQFEGVRGGKEFFYAHAGLEDGLRLARENGIDLGGKVLAFEDVKRDWMGGSTTQIKVVEIDESGTPVWKPQPLYGPDGRAQSSVDPRFLTKRLG